MHTFVKNAVSGLMLSALFLLVLSVTVRAQVLAHSAEVAGTIGYDHTSITSNPPASPYPTSQYFYGGSGGYNVTPYVTVLGEYKFDPLVSPTGNTFKWHSQLAGAAARINFTPSKKIVPYAIVGAGYDRLTATTTGIDEYTGGYYVNFGGGASVYCGKHWGIRPELRYERQHTTYGPINEIITANVVDLSGSVFYQFGGTGKKKK
ncbi:MAG: outer membrane beta-barrel protein [Terracidiphilus sp.]|jgi:hypothetical protein